MRALPSSSVPLGLAMLAAGFAVYAVARPMAVSLGCAPTFFHTAAFSLLTAGAPTESPQSPGGLESRIGRQHSAICGAWMAINMIFELGQHPVISARVVTSLPAWFEHIALLDRVGPYFARGQFDPLDLAAAAAGAGFAWFFLRVVAK